MYSYSIRKIYGSPALRWVVWKEDEVTKLGSGMAMNEREAKRAVRRTVEAASQAEEADALRKFRARRGALVDA